MQIILSFLSIFVVAFYFLSYSAINTLTSFIIDEKIRNDYINLEQLTTNISPLLEYGQTHDLYNNIVEASSQFQCRIVLLDLNGKVQSDSHNQLNGTRLKYKEVFSILYNEQNKDFAIRKTTNSSPPGNFLSKINPWRIRGDWSSFVALAITSSSGNLSGVILAEMALGSLINNISLLQDKIFFYFLLVVFAIFILSLLFSQIITYPIANLTKGIYNMSKGDFSVRVPVKGSKELRNLTHTFNNMSAKLESLDTSRNQFISNASHELKTPLTTMKIMLENILHDNYMPKDLMLEFLNDINKEIDRLNYIINDLLTLVQADTHNIDLNKQTILLSDLIDEALHRLKPLIEQKKHSVSSIIDDSGEIFADAAKLQQVVYNVLNNSFKYTNNGGFVHIELKKLGSELMLSISDNGPGIPYQDQPFIFDRFYRVDRARSRETGGTGLGLSIVQQIILLHNGNIIVDSVPNEGTKFIIYLPTQDI